MTDEQIGLVKRTWKLFRDIAPAVVGDAFYSKLFNDNPTLRQLFPEDMREQYRKLMDMLSTIVARLDRLDELNEEIAALARRHVNYGVRPGHYKLIGRALLWTLEQGLGVDWTREVKIAWSTCYNKLADTMIAASQPQSTN